MLQHARNIVQSDREVLTSLEILGPDFDQVAGNDEGSLAALSSLRRVSVLEGVAQQRMSEETGSGIDTCYLLSQVLQHDGYTGISHIPQSN